MWVVVVWYSMTAGQFNCRSLEECVKRFDEAKLDGVQAAYVLGPNGKRVDLVKGGQPITR